MSTLRATIEAILGSKKAVMALLGAVVGLAGRIGWNVSPEELLAMLSPILAYVGFQGIADIGKPRAEAESAAPRPKSWT